MSGVVKSVGKVFKKVAKTVVKVAPMAIAVGAIALTGGAALGLAPAMAAGGWGGMAATIGAKLGGTGMLGSVMTGAITQAGYGALAGGAMSLVQGENIMEGASEGAMLGAASGGISGGFKAATAGAKLGGAGNAATQGAGSITHSSGAVTHGLKQSQPGFKEIPFNASAGGGAGAGAGAGGGSGGGGLFAKGGWLERNQELVGGAAKGLGQGMLADAEQDAARKLQREKYNRIAQNYEGTDPGRDFGNLAGARSGQSPSERFDERIYGEFEYQYNPKSGRIERVPMQGGG